MAGKLRRYNHLSFWQHITWPSLVLHNLKDSFLVGFGIIQSFFKLVLWRPDAIFTKGGYVCLPVGIAARFLRIPIVVHDSDAHPGLTNRILSKWAHSIATGAPLEYYSYPKNKSHYVGIPINHQFMPTTAVGQRQAKEDWEVDPDRPLLVVTGGGLGAKRINDTVGLVLSKLLKNSSVILISGSGQYDELRAIMPKNSNHFRLHSFVDNMHSLLAAADVVVARAGATTILELAATQKPTILIPNPKLTGGHQVKNAKVYGDAGAVKVLDEDDLEERPELLVDGVKEILDNPTETKKMAKKFLSFAKPDAAADVAKLILEAAKR